MELSPSEQSGNSLNNMITTTRGDAGDVTSNNLATPIVIKN